jgi:BirA family transcriptional regulator, biotin operon repressor / biotin---[acetyl-CoA-carboxylase] ligase
MALLDLVLLKSRLGLLAGRFDVDAVDTCDSTSSELLRRAEHGTPAGAVVVADRQTAGRGRRGRTWLSVPGESLTFSLLWRFACPSGGLAGLSLAVGVALAQGLEALDAHGICLKWPNDVLLRSGDDFAKLAGVLVELASDAQGTQAVIGIGLNLKPPRADLPQPAAGLDQALASPPDPAVVLAAILQALAGMLDTFAVDGFGGVKMQWQQRHAWQQAEVQVASGDDVPLAGRCLGVDDDGALLLATSDGIRRILAGDVSLRRA